MTSNTKAYTVTAVTRMIKTILEESFGDIWVEGEISGYTLHRMSGHRYFSLKDDQSLLKATLWRSLGASLKFELEDGQKVLCFGNITVYEKNGQYQFNCKKIVPVGIGQWELAFRQLYNKLQAEGLFEDERKKAIPLYPERIGLVTAPGGAAVRDIIQIAKRRNDAVQLIIYPVLVQGDGADDSIAAGIEYFNTRTDIDLIITGRGGGSIEDLWCFNSEKVVRAIVASGIPVVSAVGHEVDTTLADFAADLRAPTPSAAAELTVWSKGDFLEQVQSNVTRQALVLKRQLEIRQENLRRLLSRPVFLRPMEIVIQRQQYLDNLVHILHLRGKNSFESIKNRVSLAVSKLDALSPLKILARGYSVSRKLAEKRLLKSIEEIAPGEQMVTTLSDGSVISIVQSKKKHE